MKFGDRLPTYATHLFAAYTDQNQTETTRRLIQMFVEQVQRNGSIPLVVTFPFFVGAASADELDRFFAPGGHYSEVGNQVVSKAVLNYLCQEELLSDCAAR